jgi:dTDP-glucose 4,6-dehydratase
MYKRLLVTGGAGFIGSGFIRHMLAAHDSVRILNLDKLTYAGNLENLRSVESNCRYLFHHGDIVNATDVEAAFSRFSQIFHHEIDAVVHFAAESHVDRSIEDPIEFLNTNVIGTQVLLNAARKRGVERFIHVSTDEVYGTLGQTGSFSESSPIQPNSPYAASKASSDLIARSYYETYGMPVIITRCSNNYGPYQFPEKLIPLMISNAVEDKRLPVYGDGLNVRDWIHVEDHCSAIATVLAKGVPGNVYNIGGHSEKTNIEVVRTILKLLNKSDDLIQFITDRPGHDKRYAINTEKIENDLGWKPRRNFEEGIADTVEWYLSNRQWTDNVKSFAYRDYYQRMYNNRETWMAAVS